VRTMRSLLQERQYQAGIRCPHQICRDMHQSRMFLIHSKYVFFQISGIIWTLPSSTTWMAGAARGLMRTNHWGVRNGSMGV